MALARAAAKHGGTYSSHVRNEGTGVAAAVKEAIAVGEKAGLPVDVIHLKIADQELGKMAELVALIDAARKRGVDGRGNVYPYTTEQTPHREAGLRLVRLSLEDGGGAATLTAEVSSPRSGRRA